MERAMLNNMLDKTGKSIETWIEIVKEENLCSNKDIVEFLKEKHSVGHFYAHLIAKKSK